MAEKSEKDALLALVQSKKGKSETARLMELLPEVEAALSSGTERRVVFETLQGLGFTFTFDSFLSSLHRLRKRKAIQTSNPNASAPKTEAKPSTPIPPPVNQFNKGPNPQESPPAQPEEEDEETRVIQEYKKTIAHLPAVQQGKKMADFLEKLQENKMLPSTRRWLGDKK